MDAPPKDKPPEEPTIAADDTGKRLTKRLKQLKREVNPEQIVGILQKDEAFYFAGDFELAARYVIDSLVRHAASVSADPLQIVFDLIHQYGYADKGSNLILPGDSNVVKKNSSGDGTPLIFLPNGKGVH